MDELAGRFPEVRADPGDVVIDSGLERQVVRGTHSDQVGNHHQVSVQGRKQFDGEGLPGGASLFPYIPGGDFDHAFQMGGGGVIDDPGGDDFLPEGVHRLVFDAVGRLGPVDGTELLDVALVSLQKLLRIDFSGLAPVFGNGFNEFVEGESPFGGHFDEILTVNGLERIFLAGYGPEQDQHDGEDAFHGPAIYG